MAKAITVEENKTSSENALVTRWENTTGFLTDVRNEMRKVNAPGRQEVQTTTLVVIATVFAFAAYFYVVDLIIGTGLDKMLHKLTSH